MIRKKGKPEGVVLIFLGLAILFGLTDSLNKLYRAERARRAEAHFAAGDALARAGSPAAAVEEYRAALTFAHNEPRYELALATSLVDLGRLDEAASHLLELHDRSPENAEIDLMLARIAAQQGRIDDAVANYHRAIYGLWPREPEKNRVQARFAVVDTLARAGQPKQALADLLALAGDAPDDPAVLDRAGARLLQLGSPEHAAEVFSRALANNPHDGEAALGLARAEFQRGNYSAAAARLRRALRLDPANADARRLLDETDEVLTLDPTPVSLPASERYARARRLVEKTADALRACSGAAAEEQAVLPASRRRDGDTPAAISLAQDLWQRRQQACGSAAPSDPALALVMGKLSK